MLIASICDLLSSIDTVGGLLKLLWTSFSIMSSPPNPNCIGLLFDTDLLCIFLLDLGLIVSVGVGKISNSEFVYKKGFNATSCYIYLRGEPMLGEHRSTYIFFYQSEGLLSPLRTSLVNSRPLRSLKYGVVESSFLGVFLGVSQSLKSNLSFGVRMKALAYSSGGEKISPLGKLSQADGEVLWVRNTSFLEFSSTLMTLNLFWPWV